MLQGKSIVVIAPCFNEEAKIGSVVKRIENMPVRIVDEIVVIDDGSTDRSASICRELGATVIELGITIGVGAAIRRGFEYALEKKHDIIVVIAGNNKDEPNEISALVEPILAGHADFVQGSRFLGSSSFGAMPLYRRVATRVHPLFFSLCSGKWVTESTNGFRAFRSELLNDHRIDLHQPWLNEYELEPYLYYKVITLGYRTAEIPCTKIYPPHAIGYTKMKPFIGWWSILRPLVLLKLGLKS